MKFITANNPTRLITKVNGKHIMLQDDNGDCIISQFKISIATKSKCIILWKGDIEDFIYEFKGVEEHGQMNIEKAFTNFLKK